MKKLSLLLCTIVLSIASGSLSAIILRIEVDKNYLKKNISSFPLLEIYSENTCGDSYIFLEHPYLECTAPNGELRKVPEKIKEDPSNKIIYEANWGVCSIDKIVIANSSIKPDDSTKSIYTKEFLIFSVPKNGARKQNPKNNIKTVPGFSSPFGKGTIIIDSNGNVTKKYTYTWGQEITIPENQK